MNVIFTNHLQQTLNELDETLKDALDEFIFHVKKHGLRGLQGRNKSSDDIAPTTQKNLEKIQYAQKHCLWHYHLGVPYYLGKPGDMTSQYVLHYSRYDEFIVLIDIVSHPPFALPSIEKMVHST